MKIGQVSFLALTEPGRARLRLEGPRTKYQGQVGPTPSQYWRNFER